jgi:predicted  nucleic acid-binding Zn-ribbon protein
MNSNSPEVAELIERIRHERAQQSDPSVPEVQLDLPDPMVPLPSPPAVPNADLQASLTGWAALANLIARAREKITVQAWIPVFLRPLARNQGGYNGILLEAIERLGDGNRELREEIEGLRAGLRAQSAWLGELLHAREAERAWMRRVEPYLLRGLLESDSHRRGAEKGESRLDRLEEQNHHARNDLEQLGIRASYVEAQAAGLDERVSHWQSQSDEQAGRFQALKDHLDQRLDQLAQHVGRLQTSADSQGAHFAEVRGYVDRFGDRLSDLQRQLDEQTGRADEARLRAERLAEQLAQLQRHPNGHHAPGSPAGPDEAAAEYQRTS